MRQQWALTGSVTRDKEILLLLFYSFMATPFYYLVWWYLDQINVYPYMNYSIKHVYIDINNLIIYELPHTRTIFVYVQFCMSKCTTRSLSFPPSLRSVYYQFVAIINEFDVFQIYTCFYYQVWWYLDQINVYPYMNYSIKVTSKTCIYR